MNGVKHIDLTFYTTFELRILFQVSGVGPAAGLKSGQFNREKLMNVQSVYCSGHVKFHSRFQEGSTQYRILKRGTKR